MKTSSSQGSEEIRTTELSGGAGSLLWNAYVEPTNLPYKELKSSSGPGEPESQHLGNKLGMILCALVTLRKDFCALLAASLGPDSVRDLVFKEIRQRQIVGT